MIAWLQQFILAGHPLTVWIGWTWTISSIVLTTWIILQRKSPVSTLAWIMVLNLMPVVGLLVYAYFGPQRIKRQRDPAGGSQRANSEISGTWSEGCSQRRVSSTKRCAVERAASSGEAHM